MAHWEYDVTSKTTKTCDNEWVFSFKWKYLSPLASIVGSTSDFILLSMSFAR
jgi:hypothetical protein